MKVKKFDLYISLIFFVLVIVALTLKPTLGVVIFFVFIIWFVKYLIKPLHDVSEKIEKFLRKRPNIGHKPFTYRLKDWIEIILEECGNLQKRIEEIEKSFEILTELSSSAIAVFDEKGKIKFFNESFNRLFPKFEAELGHFYWEIIRGFELNELIKKLIDEGDANLKISKEVEIDGRSYLANAFKTSDGDIYLTLDDISSKKELAEVKRELVENISHELKTPLSNIKGYIETIEEEIQRLGRKKGKLLEIINYLEPVKRNTDRLIRIINDLLILSKVEAGVKFEEEKIDFKGLIHGILKMYEKNLKDKGLFCKVKISKELPEFWGDVYRMEQLLSNLIDNAIKYTDTGGIKIKVEPASESKWIKITVEDTGIGIAKEHLPRIFERFYVVDKSRSRQSGGTGLGLSIVKHIVLMYNGSINVESKVGVGTKFEILLPVRNKRDLS